MMTLEGFKGKAKSVFNTAANFVKKDEPASAGVASAFLLFAANMSPEVIAGGSFAMYALSRAAVAVRPKDVKAPTL
ncbi:MAG: hypothetical protein KAS59_03995 [Alphaproteobacteria bacterium]|nr:hypothetical protein [Alphaproteobacteria bacterium]